MFRRLELTSDPDASYPADLKQLGYFVDSNGCIRDAEAPEYFFRFHGTNNERHNEVRGEAMRVCQRREVLKRLAALGIKELYLPTLSSTKPEGPHVPILVTAPEALRTRKRIIILINDDTYQDLGILAYRELQRDVGVNGGSIINFVKELVRRTRSDADADINGKLDKDGAGIEKNEDIPGVIVLNTGQLLYSHKFNETLSARSWSALPRISITHDPVMIDDLENRVDGHRTTEEHIKTVFNTVMNNADFVSPEAELYVVAIENGAEKLINFLSKDFRQNVKRIAAVAVMQSTMSGCQIHDPALQAFLHSRCRQWAVTNSGNNNPGVCTELPFEYHSNAASLKPDNKASIDWLENVEGGAERPADTGAARFPDVAAPKTLKLAPETEDGFVSDEPICPTFGGGAAWIGECIFTQPIVQQSVLHFFEDVARDPTGYCNPEFTIGIDNPPSDKQITVTEEGHTENTVPGARFDALHETEPDDLPEEMINPEKQDVLDAQLDLQQMRVALAACPKGNPELAPILQRLEARISKKESQLKELEAKALAAAALSAGAAPEVRTNWQPKTNGEQWTTQKKGTEIEFAGVKADSEIVKAAGLLNTAEEELAKLDLEDDE